MVMEDPQVQTALRRISEMNRGNVRMVAEMSGCSAEETAEWLAPWMAASGWSRSLRHSDTAPS